MNPVFLVANGGVVVVGAGDGKLPQGMKKMAEGYASGAKLHTVEKAGHLPMVEQPEVVAGILTGFLAEGRE